MARQAAGASRFPLHSHRCVVDESDRDLERYHHPEGDPVWHVQLREGSQPLNKAIESFVAHWNSDCGPIAWTATADEILDKVRTVTSRMEALLRATEIDDVAGRAA